MGKEPDTKITSCCSVNGATTTVPFQPSDIANRLKQSLEKNLAKKGVALNWIDESNSPQVLVRIIEIDQGNQLLRYLLPFISPAVLEVEGEVAVPGSDRRSFHYVQKTQVGLFGGSGKGMLTVCADRVSGKIAKDVLKALQR
jgi:hypothetical protein